MKIGVISDTHDFLDPQVLRLFAGVDQILHAGDIGSPRLILKLAEIAPVTAVTGNTDDPGLHFRPIEILEMGRRKFLLQHIVSPHHPTEPLLTRIRLQHVQVVVFGHSHKPFWETIGGTIYLNPGYAGKLRFGLPRTVAILHCDGKSLRPEFLPLSDRT